MKRTGKEGVGGKREQARNSDVTMAPVSNLASGMFADCLSNPLVNSPSILPSLIPGDNEILQVTVVCVYRHVPRSVVRQGRRAILPYQNISRDRHKSLLWIKDQKTDVIIGILINIGWWATIKKLNVNVHKPRINIAIHTTQLRSSCGTTLRNHV